MRRGDVAQNLVSFDATATGVVGEGLSIGFGTAGERALDSARSPTGCWEPSAMRRAGDSGASRPRAPADGAGSTMRQ
jgi:hypothetical protein